MKCPSLFWLYVLTSIWVGMGLCWAGCQSYTDLPGSLADGRLAGENLAGDRLAGEKLAVDRLAGGQLQWWGPWCRGLEGRGPCSLPTSSSHDWLSCGPPAWGALAHWGEQSERGAQWGHIDTGITG